MAKKNNQGELSLNNFNIVLVMMFFYGRSDFHDVQLITSEFLTYVLPTRLVLIKD